MTLTAKPRPHNLSNLKRDTGYRFKDADPELVEMRAAIDASGMSSIDICDKIFELTHHVYRPSPTTIDHYMNGHTNRPQNFIVNWVAKALGVAPRQWQPVFNPPRVTRRKKVESANGAGG